jgi:hypothetical protein
MPWKNILSVLAFVVLFIGPMTAIFFWIFIKPHLGKKEERR